jgi:hypothetical protein
MQVNDLQNLKMGVIESLNNVIKIVERLETPLQEFSSKQNRRLLVHNPTNEKTRYYRNYNLFWDELTEELKKRYQVEENRYFENAHFERSEIFLKNPTAKDFLLLECEYVIEDLDSGEFWILSVSDDLGYATLREQNNPLCKKVLISQFIDYKIKHHVGNNFDKYSPWIYFPSNMVDLEQFYFKRKYQKDFESKMYFRGNVSQRPALEHFSSELLFCPQDTTTSEQYFQEMSKYKVALSMAGVGELCYRDIECMAVGIPLIRFEFQAEMYEKLIPNFHYISIPYPDDMPRHNDVATDRLAEPHHVKLVEERFKEVVNDENFLNFISKNAREYYEKNLSSKNRVKKTLEILEL